MKKEILLLISSLLFSGSAAAAKASDSEAKLPSGWLLWHSYSEYSAGDSVLYLRSPNGRVTEISGNFKNAMNGSFGSSPSDIVFMAIDESHDEWDIYRYNSISGTLINLTENSGFRNEDPRFSPDGTKIVFKRGHWDNSANDFRYELALYDTKTEDIKYLTDDIYEEAMPCFSADGRYVYFARYKNGSSAICRFETETGVTETIYDEENVTSYYPVAGDDKLYFTKWHSSENRNDMIMCCTDSGVISMPFNSDNCNCSDACPVGENEMIYSSTANGSYDLFYFDGQESHELTQFSTNKNELGASFYSIDKLKKFTADLKDNILSLDAPSESFDVDGDGKVDSFDLAFALRFIKEASE